MPPIAELKQPPETQDQKPETPFSQLVADFLCVRCFLVEIIIKSRSQWEPFGSALRPGLTSAVKEKKLEEPELIHNFDL